MKVKCSYCQNTFDDTKAVCPYCGAPNEGVIRTSKDQPTSIEELKRWYAAKKLPPYATTRFFIGENYKGPRAFGIYRDPKTQNFVVYKNLASGERKIRYEGTDEAYAVNELFMRLKEEIIQQKAADLRKKQRAVSGNQTGSSPVPPHSNQRKSAARKKKKNFLLRHPILCAVLLVFSGIGVWAAWELHTTPEAGYYEIDHQYYYHADVTERDGWFACSADEQWQPLDMEDEYPEIYESRKNAEKYFLSETWNPSISCPDALKSVAFQDYQKGSSIRSGYYRYEDSTYYHLGDDIYSQWYIYDNGWRAAAYSDLPEQMSHSSLAEDFYYTPVWNEETQITDFEETSYFTDYQDETNRRENDSDSNDDYDWDSDDSWDDTGTDWDSDW